MHYDFHPSEREDLSEHVLRCEARYKAMMTVIENNSREMRLLRRAIYGLGGTWLLTQGPETIVVLRALIGLG